MKTIYRVENEFGKGCYRDENTKEILQNHACYCNSISNEHPLSLCDKGINRNIKDNEISGFLNLKQALKWFTFQELKDLRVLGYQLKKLTVKKITAISENQVLAIRWKNSFLNY